MMVAPDDETPHCNPGVARAVFEALPGPRRWIDSEGGHFGRLYPSTKTFRRVVSMPAAFLREVLVTA